MRNKSFMPRKSKVVSTVTNSVFDLIKGEIFEVEKEPVFRNGETWIKLKVKGWLPSIFFEEVE